MSLSVLKWRLEMDARGGLAKGGGGGDGGAGARQAAEQQRQAEAIARVNQLFGVGQEAAAAAPDRGAFFKTLQRSQPKRVRPFYPSSGDPEDQAPQTYFDQSGYDAAMADYNNRLSQPTETSRNKDAREALYGKTKDAVREFHVTRLNQDQTGANRSLRFWLARQGLSGGSQQIDQGSELDRRYNNAVLDIGNKADSAASEMRNSDEQARIGLISRINSGMDVGSAASSALAQLQSNAETARNNAVLNTGANVFADLVDIYNNQQTQQGRNQARGNGMGAFFNASGSNGQLQK